MCVCVCVCVLARACVCACVRAYVFVGGGELWQIIMPGPHLFQIIIVQTKISALRCKIKKAKDIELGTNEKLMPSHLQSYADFVTAAHSGHAVSKVGIIWPLQKLLFYYLIIICHQN